MKKLLSIFVIVFVVFGVYGQDKEKSSSDRKFVVKFMPIDYYALRSYSFEVERMLNGKNSVTLGVGIPNNQSLIGKYGIDATSDLKAASLGIMHIRAAYRHYAGKSGLPRGFYIEPYLKYQNVKANGEAQFKDDANNPYMGKMDAKISTMNAGFQMGTQFLIAKRVSLDFYFLGLEAGLANVDLTGTPTPSNPQLMSEMKNELQKNVDDLPSVLRDKIKVSNTNESVKVKGSGLFYPYFRGGISIGIAF